MTIQTTQTPPQTATEPRFKAPAKYSNPKHYENKKFHGVYLPAEFLATFESPFELAAFVALQVYANFETGECTPTYAEIAKTGRMGRSKAAEMLAKMKADGWVAWTRRRYKSRMTGKNRTTSNRYNVALAARPTAADYAPATPSNSSLDGLSQAKDSPRDGQQAVSKSLLTEHKTSSAPARGQHDSAFRKGSSSKRRLSSEKSDSYYREKYGGLFDKYGEDWYEKRDEFPDQQPAEESAPEELEVQRFVREEASTSDGHDKQAMYAHLRDHALRGSVSPATYAAFISQTEAPYKAQIRGKLVITAPHDVAAEHIRRNCLGLIRDAVARATTDRLIVEVVRRDPAN